MSKYRVAELIDFKKLMLQNCKIKNKLMLNNLFFSTKC
jgi:hypothetical protein